MQKMGDGSGPMSQQLRHRPPEQQIVQGLPA